MGHPVFANGRLVGAVHEVLLRPPAGFRFRWLLENGRWGVLTLVLLSALSVALFARSRRRSLAQLESATGRVAAGDLDSPLHANGRDEVAAATRSFERMRLALQEQQRELQAQRDCQHGFLMAVSYDLRTPLTSIKAYLEAVTDGMAPDAATRGRYLRLASERVDVLEGRITELETLLRIRSDEWEPQTSIRDLAAELETLCAANQEDLLLLGRRLDVDLGQLHQRDAVAADWTLFSRITDNIIQNTLLHTPGTEATTIAVGRDRDFAMLTITDRGPGISADQLEHIFDPFFRGSHSRREPGSGLGLTVARSIAEAHGWELRASSKVGAGTSFSLRIGPLVDSDGVQSGSRDVVSSTYE